MAQYKVPQDVEADDKLLGPFSFRQFIYLMITVGFIAAAWALAQVFPLLALIPVPIILIFGVLALPLRKDQPMETYLVAIINFFLKPKTRFWNPGQSESTVIITAPKIVEKQLTKNISEEEASRRLSFLAEVADTEGRSIKGSTTAVREEFVAEADSIDDMFSPATPLPIDQQISSEAAERHAEAVEKMRTAIQAVDSAPPPTISLHPGAQPALQPTPPPPPPPAPTPPSPPPLPPRKLEALTTAPDFTVATIQKEANRLVEEHEEEVYISLH